MLLRETWLLPATGSHSEESQSAVLAQILATTVHQIPADLRHSKITGSAKHHKTATFLQHLLEKRQHVGMGSK